jgi:hypothetical protein
MTQSEKECERCTATTKSGDRCRNRTCRGDRCWQHLKRDSGLRVKASQIPGAGLGLWTTRRFKPNEKLGKYTGEELTWQQVEQRYPRNKRGEYVLCKNQRTCVDAKKTNTNVVRYAWCVACATVAQVGGTHYSIFCLALWRESL